MTPLALGRRLAFALLAAFVASPFAFASPETSTPTADRVLGLWPEGRMPGRGSSRPEGEKAPAGDGVRRIIDVSVPTLAFFPAPRGETSLASPAAIVCPGGGYRLLAYDKEGIEIAAWLNSVGVSALVLKYRVPDNRDGAFQDIQRALRLARRHASALHLDPARLGVVGFSAGGHLAARLATGFASPAYERIDEADDLSCRPDFALLVYPAYLDADGRVAPEVAPRADSPPTLLVHNDDDDKFISGTRLYAAALAETRVPHRLLLYPDGGHGYGLRSAKTASAWPADAMPWLHAVTTYPTD